MKNEDTPVIAAKAPAKVALEAGKEYFWCRCGKSKSQPFCDGLHRDTSIIDGRGGGIGAAPLLFRNNISVPTIPALALSLIHI